MQRSSKKTMMMLDKKVPPYAGNKPIKPLEYKESRELTEAQIRLAYTVWDNLMPEYKGMLNANFPSRWQVDIAKKAGLLVRFLAAEVDRLVYELYDLTDEEIRIVEESIWVIDALSFNLPNDTSDCTSL